MFRTALPLAVLMSAVALPAAAQDVASVTLSHKTVQLQVGQRAGVYATANNARGVVLVGQRFEWTTSDARIVRVEVDRDQPDLAYLIGAGEGLAQVQVRAGSRTDAAAVQVSRAEGAQHPPPAGPPAAVLRIEPSNVLLLPVETRPLLAVFLREDGTPAGTTAVTWRSHNPAVVTVTEDGRLVGQADGRAVVEAGAASGLVATASVEVTSADLAFAPPTLALSPESEALAQVVVPAQGNRTLAGPAFSWRSSDENVARVSPLGLVHAVGAGRTTVTAEGLGRTATLPVSVHRTVVELQWLPRRDQGPVTVPLNGSVAFTVEALDAQGQVVSDALLLWSLRDTAIATFDTATRRLHGRAMGQTRLELKGPGPGLNVAWDVRVVAGGLRIAPKRVGLGPRDTLSIAASWTDDTGQRIGAAADLTWKTTNAAVALVTAAGDVTAVGPGRAQIVAATAWGSADTADLYVQGALLVTSNRGGSADLYAVDPGTPDSPLRLTSDPSVEAMGAYAPDGASIVYVSNREGAFDLYVANADGSSPRRLTQTPATEYTPRWTSDGATIVFAAQAAGARAAQIWTVGADGTGARLLTEGEATNFEPAISPDGGTIAFTSTRDGNYEIYLMAADGSQQRNVSRSPQKETHPAWFPDGRLAYVQEGTVGGRIIPVVVRHDLGTGEVTTITPPDLAVTDFAVSARGDVLALEVSALAADGRFDRRIVFFPLDGGPRVELPRQTPAEQLSSPSFRPR
jgi:TolB protein